MHLYLIVLLLTITHVTSRAPIVITSYNSDEKLMGVAQSVTANDAMLNVCKFYKNKIVEYVTLDIGIPKYYNCMFPFDPYYTFSTQALLLDSNIVEARCNDSATCLFKACQLQKSGIDKVIIYLPNKHQECVLTKI